MPNLFERNTGYTGLLVIVLIMAVFTVHKHFSLPQSGEAELRYTESLMKPVATAVHLLNERPDVIVLAFRAEKESAVSGPLKAMLKKISAGGIDVRKVEYIYRGNGADWQDLGGFPYGEFLRMVEKYPGAGAVVSLCGPPYGAVDDEALDPMELPPLVLARPVDVAGGLGEWIESGRVAAAMLIPSTNKSDPTAGEDNSLRISDLWKDRLIVCA